MGERPVEYLDLDDLLVIARQVVGGGVFVRLLDTNGSRPAAGNDAVVDRVLAVATGQPAEVSDGPRPAPEPDRHLRSCAPGPATASAG